MADIPDCPDDQGQEKGAADQASQKVRCQAGLTVKDMKEEEGQGQDQSQKKGRRQVENELQPVMLIPLGPLPGRPDRRKDGVYHPEGEEDGKKNAIGDIYGEEIGQGDK